MLKDKLILTKIFSNNIDYLWKELPFTNFTFGDVHARLNATVHFPWGSTQVEAETAAHSVSPGDEGILGPEEKFSRSKCPSLNYNISIRTNPVSFPY